MSATASNDARVSELVDELEAVQLEVDAADLDALAQGLERRQRILDQLQEADASALSPESRRTLRARIEVVRTRDAEVLEVLMAQHAEIAEALEESGRARAAARGYRASSDGFESGTRRTA